MKFMLTDVELLRNYAERGSEDAFAELVHRHLNLVYSAALRQVGGAVHLAEDVSQSVFVDMARKAGALSERKDIVGWLFTSTHFAAAKMRRTELRRNLREQESFAMSEANQSGASERWEWEKLSPVIDEAMLEMNASDRQAILMRYFENRPWSQLGTSLGVTENAARMRVERSLEKLRGVLMKRGVVGGVAGLASSILDKAIGAAPTGLGAKIVAAASVPLMAGSAGFAILNIMMTSTLKKAAVGIAFAAIASTAVHFNHQAYQSRLELATAVEKLGVVSNDLAEAQEVIQGLKNRDLATQEMLSQRSAEIVQLRAEAAKLRVLAAQRAKPGVNGVQSGSSETMTIQTPGQPPKPDPKTLYELARVGQINGFKGLLDTYPEMVSLGSGPYSSTPLHTAAYHRNMDHLEELLKHNANVNTQNEMGFTPMHDAITGDGKPGGKEVVERLIKSGASLTIKNLSGQTPLAYAIFKNQEDIAEVIRAAGGKE